MAKISTCKHGEYDLAKSADQFIYNYIRSGKAGTGSCEGTSLTYTQCKAVTAALSDGMITSEESMFLMSGGLPGDFISTISGPDGTRALMGRVRWLELKISEVAHETGGLLEALDHDEAAIREEAALILGKMGPDAKFAVDALIKALGDENASVRQAAAIALGEIGPEAKKAKGPLLDAFEGDENTLVRKESALALCKIAPGDDKVISSFAKALKSESAFVRRISAKALGQLGSFAKGAVSSLTGALDDKDSSVRKAVAYALGSIGADAKDAVPALLTALKDSYKKVRKAAFWALNKISPETLDTIEIGPGFTVILQLGEQDG